MIFFVAIQIFSKSTGFATLNGKRNNLKNNSNIIKSLQGVIVNNQVVMKFLTEFQRAEIIQGVLLW